MPIPITDSSITIGRGKWWVAVPIVLVIAVFVWVVDAITKNWFYIVGAILFALALVLIALGVYSYLQNRYG